MRIVNNVFIWRSVVKKDQKILALNGLTKIPRLSVSRILSPAKIVLC